MICKMAENKRVRKANWPKCEIGSLIEGVALHKTITLSKFRTTDCNRKKGAAWADVAKTVSAQTDSAVRSVDEIKKKWKNLVSQAKKDLHNRKHPRTGGGLKPQESDWTDTILDVFGAENPIFNGIEEGGESGTKGESSQVERSMILPVTVGEPFTIPEQVDMAEGRTNDIITTCYEEYTAPDCDNEDEDNTLSDTATVRHNSTCRQPGLTKYPTCAAEPPKKQQRTCTAGPPNKQQKMSVPQPFHLHNSGKKENYEFLVQLEIERTKQKIAKEMDRTTENTTTRKKEFVELQRERLRLKRDRALFQIRIEKEKIELAREIEKFKQDQLFSEKLGLEVMQLRQALNIEAVATVEK